MIRLYQKEWQGIQFKSFAKLSTTKLADAKFYEKFYQAFFQHHNSWEDIDASWRKQKAAVAKFILSRLHNDGDKRVLSVSCGMGYVEHCLLNSGFSPSSLEVTEVADTPLRWLNTEIPPENIHIGFVPDCFDSQNSYPYRYDYIYGVAVEYTMKQSELIDFIANLKKLLKPDGRCLLISFSSEKDSVIESTKRNIKNVIKWLLHITSIRKLGQFWGWIRSEKEIQYAMKQSGFSIYQDGYVETTANHSVYWIEGKN